jgi:hypothetical protein
MSIQLASPPIKARPGAAGVADRPSVELPAQIYPGRTNLTRVLLAYETSLSDIADFEGKITRYDVDEQAVIDAENLSISDSSDQIARIQRDRDICKARLSAKGTAKTKASRELSDAVRAGQQELSGLVLREYGRRRDIIWARIVTAGQLEGHIHQGEIDEFCGHSKLLWDVRRWNVSAEVLLLDGVELKVNVAKQILANFEGILAELGKQI